jgi:hypothetical protein
VGEPSLNRKDVERQSIQLVIGAFSQRGSSA